MDQRIKRPADKWPVLWSLTVTPNGAQEHPHAAARLPNLASIGKVAEFTEHPPLFFLIASAPRPAVYREQRSLTVSSNGPRLKWPGFTVDGRAAL